MMSVRLRRNIAAAAIACAAVMGPVSSRAETVLEPGYWNASLSTIGEYWNSAWYTVVSWMPGSSSGTIFTEQFRKQTEYTELDFKSMMDAAGYAVKSIKMGAGVVPKFGLSFGQKREISEFDRDYAYRLLRKHARTHSGPTAIAERVIVQTILELQKFPKYDLAKVDVTLLPVPSVEFIAEPKVVTLDSETSYVVRRIEQLNMKLDHLGPQ